MGEEIKTALAQFRGCRSRELGGRCPHPRVTAVAKKGNRRAACPLPGQGEGSESLGMAHTLQIARFARARTSLLSVILEENPGSGTLCEGDKSRFA